MLGRGRRLQGESCLPRATRPGQGQETEVVTGEQRYDLRELALAAQERRGGHREVRLVEALERGKDLVTELVDPLTSGDVLEAVLAQVEERKTS